MSDDDEQGGDEYHWQHDGGDQHERPVPGKLTMKERKVDSSRGAIAARRRGPLMDLGKGLG
jgi:hypothetical protein